MSIKLADAVVYLTGDRKGLDKTLKKSEKDTTTWASKVGKKIRSGLGTALKVGMVGAAAGVVALTAGITKLAIDSAKVDQVRGTFDKLAESIGTDGVTALDSLREATRSMVSDADLMQAGNKFMAMGLASTADEAAKLAEVATQLGSAMGEDATASMENFALMMANQSIPRLDSFGISSGKVRERITELMSANADLSREQAFNTAVMEQAAVTMAKVGEQGDTSAASMARIQATAANLKDMLGRAFLPILAKVLGKFGEFVTEHGPAVQDWIQNKLPVAIQKLTDFWNTKLLPILNIVWAFIQDKVIPIVQKLAAWMGNDAPKEMSKLTKWFKSTLMPIIQKVASFFVEQWNQIKGWVDDNLPLIQATIKTVSDFILKLWEWLWPHLGGVVGGAWEIIKNVIDTAIHVAEGVIKGVMLAIQGDWEGAWESVKGALVTAWEGIKTHIGLTLNTILGIFDTSMEDLWKAIKLKWENIRLGTRMKLYEIRDVILSLKEKFVNAGGALIDGIKEGVKAKAKALIDKVKGVVQDAIGAAKALLGISSPSKVFQEIGGNIVGGLAKGIEGSSEIADAAIDKVLLAVGQKAAQGISAIGAIMAGSATKIAKGISGIELGEKTAKGISGIELGEKTAKGISGIAKRLQEDALAIKDYLSRSYGGGGGGGVAGAIKEMTVELMNVEAIHFGPAQASVSPAINQFKIDLTAQYEYHQSEATLKDTVKLLQMAVT